MRMLSRSTGGDDSVARIWSTQTIPWKSVTNLTLKNGKIRSLSWHPNSWYLIAAGISFGIALWNTSTWEEIETGFIPTGYLHYVDWSPIGDQFVVDTRVYSLATLQNASSAVSLQACRLCTVPKWSPDGNYIATAFGAAVSLSNAELDPPVAFGELIRNLTTVETYLLIGSRSRDD